MPIPAVKRSKIDSKARKLVFVGYSMENKGYRFLDRETQSIIVSRDARFFELSNGSSCVQIPVSVEKALGSQHPEKSKQEEEEIDVPKQEERLADPDALNASGSDEFYEADEPEDEDQAVGRRSTRSNVIWGIMCYTVRLNERLVHLKNPITTKKLYRICIGVLLWRRS